MKDTLTIVVPIDTDAPVDEVKRVVKVVVEEAVENAFAHREDDHS